MPTEEDTLLSVSDVARLASCGRTKALDWLRDPDHPLGAAAFKLQPDRRDPRHQMLRVPLAAYRAWRDSLTGGAL